MTMVRRLSLAGALASALLLVLPGMATAAPAPNFAVFFYQPGLAVTGTVRNGVFAQDQTITAGMQGWTAGAVSRDTLMLLNGPGRRLQLAGLTVTGGLNGGATYTNPRSVSLTKTYSRAAASCDSYLLYNPATGAAMSGHLTHGFFDTKHVFTLAKGFTSIDASCDTITLLNKAGSGVIGVLKGGAFTKKGTLSTGLASPLVTHTATSFLRYSTVTHLEQFGSSHAGVETTMASGIPMGSWDHLAGTNDSALFYNSTTGAGFTIPLVNGAHSIGGQTEAFSAGWQVIAGGR